MFVAVDDADLRPPIPLNRIPTRYDITINSRYTVYNLLGIVRFKPPYLPSLRHSREKNESSKKKDDQMIITENDTAIGHYTAICLRPDGKFTEYDDLKEKENNKSGTSPICPSLLIYFTEN